MNKRIVIFLGIILIPVIIGISLLNKGNRTNNQIRFGFIGPLTGDGAAWGIIERNAALLAIEEINHSGGIGGKTIGLIEEDGKCNGKDAVSAARKLIEVEHVSILLISCSQEVLPVAPISEQFRSLVFTSYAAASEISNVGDYIFRNSWTNKDMGTALAKAIVQQHTHVAVISETNEFASDLRDQFIQAFQASGGIIVANENFLQGQKDIRTQISKILEKNPDAVLINPNGPSTGIPILKQLSENGYKGARYGNFFGGSLKVQSTPEAEGMIFVSDPPIEETTKKQEIFDHYKKRFGSYPDLSWPLAARYDVLQILKRAITTVGEDPTTIKNYLYDLRPPFTGLLGTYYFDKNGDAVGLMPSVQQIQKGKVVPYVP